MVFTELGVQPPFFGWLVFGVFFFLNVSNRIKVNSTIDRSFNSLQSQKMWDIGNECQIAIFVTFMGVFH